MIYGVLKSSLRVTIYYILLCIRVCAFLYINKTWILFEDNVNKPWSQGLNILGICCQEKIYSGCLACISCCVVADDSLYS